MISGGAGDLADSGVFCFSFLLFCGLAFDRSKSWMTRF
jgi:hypothetical protein